MTHYFDLVGENFLLFEKVALLEKFPKLQLKATVSKKIVHMLPMPKHIDYLANLVGPIFLLSRLGNYIEFI